MWQPLFEATQFSLAVTLPNLLLLGLGLWLRYRGQVDKTFCAQASNLVFNWSLPLLMFFSIVGSDADYRAQLDMVIAGALCALLLFIGSEWVAKKIIPNVSDRGVFVQGVYRGNTGIVGLAFCANAYGAEGIAVGAVMTGAMTFLYNILAVITLTRSLNPGKKIQWLGMLAQMAKNPLILSILIALAWKQLTIPVPNVLDQTGHFLASMALPLALLCAGAAFDVKSVLKVSGVSQWASVGRLLVAPVVAVLVGKIMGLEGVQFGVLFMMSATPVAAASYVMVKAMGGNDVAAANIVGITTFGAMFVAALGLGLMKPLGWL